MRHLFESIFDKDLATNDTVLDRAMFEDRDPKFWVDFAGAERLLSGWGVRRDFYDNSEIDINRRTVKMNYLCLDGVHQNPLQNAYTLYVQQFNIGSPDGRGPHPKEPIGNNAGFKDIYCGYLNIDGFCEKIVNCTFNIDTSISGGRGPRVRVNWAGDVEWGGVKIIFDSDSKTVANGIDRIIMDGCSSLPDLHGLESNARTIQIYDPSLFDQSDVKDEMTKFFGPGTLHLKGVERPKNIRNIIAAANNLQKYGSIDPEDLKPAQKVSDLFDIKGFKELKVIHLSNNNAEIMFIKDGCKTEIEQYARYIRLNNMQKYKDYSVDQMVDLLQQNKSDDGWIIAAQKKYYG